MNVAKVEEAMLALDRRDLAALIHRGIQVLDHGDIEAPQDDIDTTWRDELDNRIDDIQSGKVETMPLDESFARARAAVAAIRK